MSWFILAPFSLLFTLFAMIAAPVLPLFANANGWLPRWLWWFQTPDNSLDGDGGWKHEHWQWRYKLPGQIATYIGRVGWLWRNPAYGLDDALSIPRGDVLILWGSKLIAGEWEPYGWYILITTTGWQLYWTWTWGRINLGWKLWCQPNETASLVVTVGFRIRSGYGP